MALHRDRHRPGRRARDRAAGGRSPSAAGLVLAFAAVAAACGPAASPHDEFLDRLAEHCGQAFTGRIVANEPAAEDDPFAGERLVMHVRTCGDREVRVPPGAFGFDSTATLSGVISTPGLD